MTDYEDDPFIRIAIKILQRLCEENSYIKLTLEDDTKRPNGIQRVFFDLLLHPQEILNILDARKGKSHD